MDARTWLTGIMKGQDYLTELGLASLYLKMADGGSGDLAKYPLYRDTNLAKLALGQWVPLVSYN
ncbi:hypothetical protein AGMMS49942_29730 [Spirochaetia bacterium]|nr:hypothetical protein AGMMS49942_29730 [Spirochaetia bacterium]